MPKKKEGNRYELAIVKVFLDKYRKGIKEFGFTLDEIRNAQKELGIAAVGNPADAIYSYRFRKPMPEKIQETQPQGKEWIIEKSGKSDYIFKLAKLNRITPQENYATIKVPDSTPEIISCYALNDEQALLAKLRYNRLLDIFLGITTYSLQNHLRTTTKNRAQLEIDELYIGIDKHGCHYIIPVQAKGGKDQLSAVQTRQDITWCMQRYPSLKCKSISAQFMDEDIIVMFELMLKDDEVKIVEEKHYKLVLSDDLDSDEITNYR